MKLGLPSNLWVLVREILRFRDLDAPFGSETETFKSKIGLKSCCCAGLQPEDIFAKTLRIHEESIQTTYRVYTACYAGAHKTTNKH